MKPSTIIQRIAPNLLGMNVGLVALWMYVTRLNVNEHSDIIYWVIVTFIALYLLILLIVKLEKDPQKFLSIITISVSILLVLTIGAGLISDQKDSAMKTVAMLVTACVMITLLGYYYSIKNHAPVLAGKF